MGKAMRSNSLASFLGSFHVVTGMIAFKFVDTKLKYTQQIPSCWRQTKMLTMVLMRAPRTWAARSL